MSPLLNFVLVIPGTSHTITQREMKPATQVERAKRRRKVQAAAGRGQGQAAANAETVYDVDDV